MPSHDVGRRRFFSTLTLGILILSGCGGDTGQLPTVRVSGSLSVAGKPVSKGTVHFHPEKGPAATGIVQDGKFTLSTYGDGDGVIAGKNKIAVEVVEEVPLKDGDTSTRSLIPAKFMNPDRSGLQLDIRPSGYSNLQIKIEGEAGSMKED